MITGTVPSDSLLSAPVPDDIACRAKYYEDKRKSFPPDCEREEGKTYAYKI